MFFQLLWEDSARIMAIKHDHDYAALPNDLIDNNIDGIHSNITIDDNIEMMLSIDQTFGILEYETFPFTHEVNFENNFYF